MTSSRQPTDDKPWPASATSVRSVPAHVAIIMDGNNRWARERGLTGSRGHRAGVEALRAVIQRAGDWGVQTLSLFAFSSENWKRPAAEVNALMELFLLALKREVRKLHDRNVRLTVRGDIAGFSHAIRRQIQAAEELTAENSGMHLVIAANYGGHWDIACAARWLARRVTEGELSVDDIDVNAMDQALDVADVPAIDLCIRTSGEQRLSNFMLWQLAYAELHFSPLLWPDFDAAAFDQAMVAFNQRKRRFGMTDQQVEVQGA